MASVNGREAPELCHASALLSHHVAQGHVCLDLRIWEHQKIIAVDECSESFTTPKLTDWRRRLTDCHVVGRPGDFKPLILDDHFRHHQKNPLPGDIVVVDEASMLDLPLLSKLVQAMPEETRLILLGDPSLIPSC